jgi:hypothetical protein
MNIKQEKFKGGYLLIQVLVFGAIAVLVVGALVSFTTTVMFLGRKSVWREEAFQAAEAGIEYYRWHLAHANTDYTDGTGTSAPSVHDFYDKDGDLIGTFTLTIIPPPPGSTLVEIKSEGQSNADSSARRTVVSQLALVRYIQMVVFVLTV